MPRIPDLLTVRRNKDDHKAQWTDVVWSDGCSDDFAVRAERGGPTYVESSSQESSGRRRRKTKRRMKKKEEKKAVAEIRSEIEFTTDEGTWISLDVSPDGKSIALNCLVTSTPCRSQAEKQS